MNENLIAQLDQEILSAETQLEALKNARKALSGVSGAPVGAKTPVEPQMPVNGAKSPVLGFGEKKGLRAPKGFLRDAVLKVIASAEAPEVNLRTIRKGLADGKYPYPLSDLSKTVSEMVDDGLLEHKPNGPWTTYRKGTDKPAKKKKARLK